MKKTIKISIIFLMISIASYAQQGFNYKAIITDNNTVLQNHNIDVKFTILKDGTNTVYQESQTTVTDNNGIIILQIGEGTPISGVFSDINWRDEQFLNVKINTGNGYNDFGTTALKSVPYSKIADKLNPTDNITIGSSTMQPEKLYISSPSVNGELVDFRLSSPNQYDDVLNLHMDAAPSSGRAQFIEASRGGSVKFRVDDDGRVFSHTGYYTDNYVEAVGDITSYANIHAWGNLAVDGEMSTDLNVGVNEVHSTNSGDADMKASFYGYVYSSGNIKTSVSSSGFTIDHPGTGRYQITANGHYDPLVIVASLASEIGFLKVVSYELGSSYLTIVKIYDPNTGDLMNANFSFVAFKK